MNLEFNYDVFLSHSSKDKTIVRELAERLRADGLRVWFDEWVIQPGEMIGLKIEQGLNQSRALVLCMSANVFASDWVTLERHTVLFRDPTNQQRRFIPLRLDEAPIRDTIRRFAYVDWRKKSEKQYAKFLAACRPPIIPAQAPLAISIQGEVFLHGHTGGIRSIAMTSDGRLAISGSDDKTIRVWEVASGKCLAKVEGHKGSIWSVAITNDGRIAVSGSVDKTIRIWDVETERCLTTLEGHLDRVWSVGVTSDGRLAVSGSADRTVRVWDVASGKCLSTLEGHAQGVNAVAVTSDGRLVVSGSADRTVRVWDVASGKCLSMLEGHIYGVTAVAVTSDGRIAVSGSADRTVRVWDVASGKCLSMVKGHAQGVNAVAVTSDGRLVVSGSDDETLRMWDVDSGKCLVTLTGHTDRVASVAVTNDGRIAVSGSADRTVRVWDVESGKRLSTLTGHTDPIVIAAVTSDGRLAISGSDDKTVRVWEVVSGKCLATLTGHTDRIVSVAVTDDARIAVSGSADKTVRIWDVESERCLATLIRGTYRVNAVAVTNDGHLALSGLDDRTVRVWEVKNGGCLAIFEGHKGNVRSIAVTGDGHLAISGSDDKTVRVWEVASGKCLGTLEGHTHAVNTVAVTSDGHLAISGSDDKTVRVWEVASGKCLGTLEGHTHAVNTVAVTSDGRIAVSGSDDKTIRVWEVKSGRCLAKVEGYNDRIVGLGLMSNGYVISVDVSCVARLWDTIALVQPDTATKDSFTRYTNAKVLLVGETGGGKTALFIQLTEGRWEPATSSTDGVQSTRTNWATQSKLPHLIKEPETEREIWLWDFAGQADYRLIHQLFMDETSLAVLVFNPQSDNPFEELGQWDRDLQRAARRPFKKLLVAGRCDRGGLKVSSESFERFRTERGFANYIETSARTGMGCDQLHEAVVRQIPWGDIPWIASPRIFRLLKNEIVKLKEEGTVLLRMAELKQQLELRLSGETFTLEQLRAVVGLLAGPGIIWQLEFGDFVLLQPERINAYAAAVIRSVRAHKEEIGCIAEEDVLAGKLDYQKMSRLEPEEERIVLLAMHQTFLDYGLCLRERTGEHSFLVFPSYFKRERPDLKEHPLVLVTYQFTGPVEEIYATLVVRLHYTLGFEQDKLWRFAADFKTPSGKRLGFKMTKKPEGAAEIEIYFQAEIPKDIQVTFIRYVHEHLMVKAQDVVRLRHYVCPNCHTPVKDRQSAMEWLTHGEKQMPCLKYGCGSQVPLWDLVEEKFASEELQRRVRELGEMAKVSIDNESRELILIGDIYSVAGEAGQIYRRYTNSDHGIDGEIEFKTDEGKATGKRLYLQLKSGDSYLYKRKGDGAEVFTIKNERWAEYWQQQAYPVMLVIRTSDGVVRWMDVSEYLKHHSEGGKKTVKQITFVGEPFTTLSLLDYRNKVLSAPL